MYILYTSTPGAVATGDIDEMVCEDVIALVLVGTKVVDVATEESSKVSGLVLVNTNELLDVVSVDRVVDENAIDCEDESVRLQVATQYAYPASICEHVGGSTAGFQSRNVSKDMLNRIAIALQ